MAISFKLPIRWSLRPTFGHRIGFNTTYSAHVDEFDLALIDFTGSDFVVFKRSGLAVIENDGDTLALRTSDFQLHGNLWLCRYIDNHRRTGFLGISHGVTLYRSRAATADSAALEIYRALIKQLSFQTLA